MQSELNLLTVGEVSDVIVISENEKTAYYGKLRSEKSVEQLFTPSFLKVKTGDKSLPEEQGFVVSSHRYSNLKKYVTNFTA